MIDSHAHVAFRQFDEDREDVVRRARQKNVRWLEIGTDLKTSKAALALAEKYPEDIIGATVGVHPSDVGPASDPDGNESSENTLTVGGPEGLTWENWQIINDLLDLPRAVAVGEIGFDFYHSWPGFMVAKQLSLQRAMAEKFIALAGERELPIVWHVRSGQDIDAHDALIDLLREVPASRRPFGVIHTFSGNKEQAEKYLALGLYLSFSGIVTFRNAGEIAKVANAAPLDRILIETDCPFLAPDPFRSKRNEPAYVKLVAEKIASLRGVSVEEIAKATEENALSFLGVG